MVSNNKRVSCTVHKNDAISTNLVKSCTEILFQFHVLRGEETFFWLIERFNQRFI